MGWVMQLPQPLLGPVGQHRVSREGRRSWYPRDNLPQHPAPGAGFGQQKATRQGDPLPFQIAWLGSRRVNPSHGRGMNQKKGQGSPRGAWGRGQQLPNMLFSGEEPPSHPRASPFPERPEARIQAPPARPCLQVHPGSDAEPSCPYNLQLMIIPVQGSALSRVHRPLTLLPLRSAQPRAVPPPAQGDHSSPGSALKAGRRKRQ